MRKLSINLQVSQRNYAFINMGDFFALCRTTEGFPHPLSSIIAACQYLINSASSQKCCIQTFENLYTVVCFVFSHTASPLFCHLKGNYLLLFFCLIRLQIGKIGCSSFVRVGCFCALLK